MNLQLPIESFHSMLYADEQPKVNKFLFLSNMIYRHLQYIMNELIERILYDNFSSK
jgi:hypothetical protein